MTALLRYFFSSTDYYYYFENIIKFDFDILQPQNICKLISIEHALLSTAFLSNHSIRYSSIRSELADEVVKLFRPGRVVQNSLYFSVDATQAELLDIDTMLPVTDA